LGALVMGAVGCGDAVGPQGSGGRDLEFVAPSASSGIPAPRQRHWNSPITDEDRSLAEAAVAAMDATAGVLPALLFSKFVHGEWRLNDLWIQFGFFGMGTGYTVTPRVEIRGSDGRLLQLATVEPRSEEQGLYSVMRPTSEVVVPTSAFCGGQAAVTVTFEVRSKGTFAGESVTLLNKDVAQAVILQQRCPDPITPLGGGGAVLPSAGGTRLWLCQYEVWTDLDGDVIDVFFFGCTEVLGGFLAA